MTNKLRTTAIASGKATWFRIFNAAGETVCDGSLQPVDVKEGLEILVTGINADFLQQLAAKDPTVYASLVATAGGTPDMNLVLKSATALASEVRKMEQGRFKGGKSRQEPEEADADAQSVLDRYLRLLNEGLGSIEAKDQLAKEDECSRRTIERRIERAETN